MKLTFRWTGGVAVASAVLLLAGCSSSGTSSESASAEPAASSAPAEPSEAASAAIEAATNLESVCFVPKFVGHPVFALANDGAQKAGTELGIQVDFVGSTKIDPAEQIKTIDNCIQQGTGAILVGALDPNALAPALKRAREAGIAVLSWDADVDPTARSLYISPTDVGKLGEALATSVADSTGGEGEWAILSSGPNVANQVEWIDAVTSYMGTDASKFGSLELVDTVYGESDDQKSYLAAQGLIDKYPNLKMIMSPDAAGLPAAARAVKDAGACGRIKVTGVALPSAMKSYMEDGCTDSFALWDFPKLGYLTVAAAQYVAGGGDVAEGSTFEAGELGTFTVGKDGVVPLGPPLVFTPENIEQYDF